MSARFKDFNPLTTFQRPQRWPRSLYHQQNPPLGIQESFQFTAPVGLSQSPSPACVQRPPPGVPSAARAAARLGEKCGGLGVEGSEEVEEGGCCCALTKAGETIKSDRNLAYQIVAALQRFAAFLFKQRQLSPSFLPAEINPGRFVG